MDVVIGKLNADANYNVRGEHLTKAKHNNSIIVERIESHYHNLTYKAIPKFMLRYLVIVSTKQLDLFPANGIVSKYLIPHVTMSGRNMDFNKKFQIPFGAYVQVAKDNNPTNTNTTRTLDGIYLQTLDNNQGGQKFMHMQTGKVITGYNMKDVTVTDLFIKAIYAMTYEQGIKTLKMQGKKKFHWNLSIALREWTIMMTITKTMKMSKIKKQV